jgi:hypothetical protein
MKKVNRDLLVLWNEQHQNAFMIEKNLTLINDLLFEAERIDNFIQSHELIDLNKYKIYKTPFQIKKWIRNKDEKAFSFLNNLN